MRPRALILLAVMTLMLATSARAQAMLATNTFAGASRARMTTPDCNATATSASTATIAPRLPAGVTFRLLANYAAEMPPDPFLTFEFGRFELDPGTETSVQEGDFFGPGLLYVESGEVTFHLPNTTDLLLCAGAQTPLGTEADYSVSNDGSVTAQLLRFRVGQRAVTGAYAATAPLVSAGLLIPRANGGYEPEPLAEGVTYYPLVIADLVDPLPASTQLFLADTRWEPGATFDGWIFCGPVGMAVEAGVLNGREPPAPNEADFPSGHFVFYPPHDAARLRNAGAEPATVLMAGVIPAGQLFATPAAECRM